MNKVLQILIALAGCYFVAFLASWGIVEGWVMFWEYGRVWNETTVPPLIVWDIFFANISMIAIIALFITPVAFIFLMWWLSR